MNQERPKKDHLSAEIDAALDGVDLQSADLNTAPEKGGKGGSGLVQGTIAGVSGDDVIVDMGPRMQGVIPRAEFDETPEVGQSFQFTLRFRSKEDDLWVLSRREALAAAAWEELTPGAHVEATVIGLNTGGLELKLGAINAFMPKSQISNRFVEDLTGYAGQKLICRVMEVNQDKNRVVLSRRAVLEEEKAAALKEMVGTIQPGEKRKGKVTRVEAFGAFVDLGSGVEGLVHVSNLSRKRVEDPKEFITEGQEVEVMVLEIKEGGKRIGLGMKQLEPDPWDDIHYRLPEDTVVNGKVTRLMDFGAFVEVVEGVEGLVHVSQLATNRLRHPKEAVSVGEEIAVRVQSVDTEARRISLSRLDPRGALIGSDEAVDEADLTRAMESEGPKSGSFGTSLGNLFKKAMEPDQ